MDRIHFCSGKPGEDLGVWDTCYIPDAGEMWYFGPLGEESMGRAYIAEEVKYESRRREYLVKLQYVGPVVPEAIPRGRARGVAYVPKSDFT